MELAPSLSLCSKASFSTFRNRTISISLIARLCWRDAKDKHIGQNAYNMIINAMRMGHTELKYLDIPILEDRFPRVVRIMAIGSSVQSHFTVVKR